MKKDQQTKDGDAIKQQLTDAHKDNAYKKNVTAAHDQAEKDMEEDAELTAQSPNDDLDEGETARLGEDVDLV